MSWYDILSQSPDTLLMVLTSITLTILFIAGAYFGSQESWYVNLPEKSQDNIWLLAALWIIVSVISYGAFYLVKDYDEEIYGQSRLLPLFLIISFLNVLWVIIFYLYQSFTAPIILISLIILLNFLIIVFLYRINPWAALTIVPLEALYIYLLYSIIRLGTNNKAL